MMNWIGHLLLAVTLAASTLSAAQADGRDGRHHGHDRGREWSEYRDHEFRGMRYRHDHYYPAPGHIVGRLPPRSAASVHGNVRFYFADGAWYRHSGGRFVVVTPPLGIAIDVLPPFYTRLWVGGVSYYYANNVYYTQSPRGYIVTQPPAEPAIVETPASEDNQEIVDQPAENQLSQAPVDLYVYPARGQSEKQLAADRKECHAWAIKKSGYDPYNASSGFQIGQKRIDYERALTACLEGRGYTVK